MKPWLEPRNTRTTRKDFAFAWLTGFAVCLWVTAAGGANFAVPYSPTGIATDPANQRIIVSSSGGGVNIYDTNGVLQTFFAPAASITDLGSGTGGNVWVPQSGNTASRLDYSGNPTLPPNSANIPSSAVAVGRELAVGGTNYLLYAVSGGSVYALRLTDNVAVPLLPTPAGTTGGDWTLRPGGYALDHVLLAFNDANTVRLYTPDGSLIQEISLNLSFNCVDVAFYSTNEIWVAEASGRNGEAVPYSVTVPAVPAAAVSVVGTNGSAAVSWSGRWLEASADLAHWQVVSNAPQPYLPPRTNPATFFRAVK